MADGEGEEFDIDYGVGHNGGGDCTGHIFVIDARRMAGARSNGFLAAVDGPEEPIPMQDFGFR